MGVVKFPVPPLRSTWTEVALSVLVLMFSLNVTVTITWPLALAVATVLASGLSAEIWGSFVSTWRTVVAPALENEANGSVGRFEAFPAWSMTRTRTRV